MNSGLFAQLALIGISVAIVFMYVKPTLADISVTQDDIYELSEAYKQAQLLNSKLSSLQNISNSISSGDRRALNAYMPDHVDDVAVLKDLENIVVDSGALLNSVGYSFSMPRGVGKDREIPKDIYYTHEFTVDISGTYSQLKEILRLTERNNYPLTVVSVTIGGGEKDGVQVEGGILNSTLIFESYSMQPGREVVGQDKRR